ncbi:glycoside hydrolase family 43 protein, partial [gut metagenome]
AGQILWGEGELNQEEWNVAKTYVFLSDGTIKKGGSWNFSTERQLLNLRLGEDAVSDLIIFAGHDWENQTETVLFTGLDQRGRSVWGKRVK